MSLPFLYFAPGMIQVVPPSDNSLRRRPALSPRRVAVSIMNFMKAPKGPLSCSAASQTATQFLVGQDPRARPLRGLVRRPPRTSGDTKSLRPACQLNRVRNAEAHGLPAPARCYRRYDRARGYTDRA